MDIKKKFFLLLLLSFGAVVGAKAQDVAIKTNLLSDAFLNANAGVEIGLAPRWTLDLSGEYNGWTVKERKWKHWLVQPEARYWFCDRFAGHFLGFHAVGGQYNVGNFNRDFSFLNKTYFSKNRRAQGWAAGVGIAYGYSWILGKHWNLEAELGVGYVYTNYDVFECKDCGRRVSSDNDRHYVGPTKAAINLVYVF